MERHATDTTSMLLCSYSLVLGLDLMNVGLHVAFMLPTLLASL